MTDAVHDPKLWSIFSGLLPTDEFGPRLYRAALDFGTLAGYEFDLLQETTEGKIEAVQAAYIDNADNSKALTIVVMDTLVRYIIPPNGQGVIPIFSGKMPRLKVSTTPSEGLTVPIYLINMPLPFLVWETVASGGGGGSNLNQVTLADDSGTGTGASVQILGANGNRKYLYVGNPSTNTHSVYVDFGMAAAAATAFELLPGGSLTMTDAGVSTQTVNVLATALDTFVLKEGV